MKFIYTITLTPGYPPICIGLYVDDYFYFSKSNNIEEKFREDISSTLQVYWHCDADWFLGM